MSEPALSELSLSEVHGSVRTGGRAGFWRRLIAFAGPAYLVSVGYMDPGNWATDLAGGAKFGYALIWVLLMSNLMAVLLQTLAARLGVVTGRDLAQACRDNYSAAPRYVLWILCELAIAATDLAELLGTTLGLNLLFNIPLRVGVIITAFDTLLLLMLQRLGIRKMEAFILGLVATIGGCFFYELFLARPEWTGVAAGFAPRIENTEALYIAIGMLGATVMPHNLYLHSALVQTRHFSYDRAGKGQAIRYNLLDSVVALNAAFFVNAAILMLAAAVFWRNGIVVEEIQQAADLLRPLLGTSMARIAFGVALLAAGQASTLTGTLAGQIVMEGFVQIRLRPWVRRLATRSMAIIPAAVVIWFQGSEGTYDLLIFSQVVLSLQLPFAIVPLLHFTSSRRAMGPFANPLWVKLIAWVVAAVIIALNAKLVFDELNGWAAGPHGVYILAVVAPAAAGLGLFLMWLTFGPRLARWRVRPAPAPEPADAAAVLEEAEPSYERIAVALDNDPSDSRLLAHALPLARVYNARLLLVHVIEGPTAEVYHEMAYDQESRRDRSYLGDLAERLRKMGFDVDAFIGHGRPAEEIIDLLRKQRCDLLVMGGHGHKRLLDLVLGQTIETVRHGLPIPVLTVR